MPFWGDSGNQGDALRRAKKNEQDAQTALHQAKRDGSREGRKKAERFLADAKQRTADAQGEFDRAKRR